MKAFLKNPKILKKKAEALQGYFSESPISCAAVLLGLSLVLGALLSPYPLSNTPKYRLGDVARSTIRANHSFLVEDKESTDKIRKSAADAVPSVYDYDPTLASKISLKVPKGFQTMREHLPDLTAQQEMEKGDFVVAAGSMEAITGSVDNFERARQDVSALLGIKIGQDIFDALYRGKFSEDFETLIQELFNSVMYKPIVANTDILFSEGNRGISVRNIVSGSESRVRDFSSYMSVSEARGEIRSRAMNFIRQYKYASLQAATGIAQSLIQPNLTLNRLETERRRSEAFDAQKPVYYQIEKGEVIAREGNRLTPRILDQLTIIRSKEKERNHLMVIGGLALLVALCLVVSLETSGFRGWRGKRAFRETILFCSVLLFTFLLTLPTIYMSEMVSTDLFEMPVHSIYYSIPIPIGAMLISVFLGVNTALMFSVIAAFLAALMLGANLHYFIFFLLGSFVAARMVVECKERGTLIKASLVVAAVNVCVVSAINMTMERIGTSQALMDASFALLGGCIAGVIVTGLLPMAEYASGFTTNIRLMERSNLESPVLRDLMLRAPGTYYHSIIVGNLVEAAAKAIGANSLLGKVASYYHDIGKMKKPDYFIENQRGGSNKHEKLAPSMSALILISHVKDGTELARKHKLGADIEDIIQQHHGTSLISYFYEKAQEARSTDDREVREEDYRYPGPKPQTKEAGIVLLADMVEAASRTLQDPTPARIQGLVQKIVNKVFSDGQLGACELTLKDLHEIAKSFNTILNGIFHHRIEYPESAEKGAPARKGKNGNTHRKPPAVGKDQPQEPQEQNPENLRRLGL